ncbi:hypothetical protein [Alteribacillus iranensis]|uniref:Uncharacterized protein YpmB n=1 Tax=Alteribacillus iranensis TaxID=930128 RepID=A0A1I1ZS43_9BACI|nr:hypothetical protein [Alteribacillus iranensis]SFE34564.1 Uncharacterized protein YpmB [Alteribacillus iranensis]
MKKWVWWSGGIAIVLVICLVTVLYISARSVIAEEMKTAENIMLQNDEISTVHQVYYYYGDQAVYTGSSVTTEGNEAWVFVIEDNVVRIMNKEEGISVENAVQQVKEQFSLQQVRSVKPGIENGEAIYEMTFEKDERLHFYYIKMKDGSFIKRYSIKET